MKIETLTLKNKLNVLFIHKEEEKVATVQIWFRAGSALEKKDHQGIAHFLEHMFFKGTPKRPGALIAKEVESFGGEINAFTSFDYTCYYINSPQKMLGQSVDILLDMVSNPEFKQQEIIPERDVVFEEYRRSLDNPNQFSFMQLQKNCFPSGYGHPILGQEKTIKNFSRKQLINFRKNYYNLSNAMLVVGGDLRDKKALMEQIEKYKMPSGPQSFFPQFILKNEDSFNSHNKEVRMARVSLSIQSPPYNDAKGAIEDLAINCLAHGESSHLHKNLVLEGPWANNCSGSTMFLANGGVHMLRLIFPLENLNKVVEIFTKTLKEIFAKGFTEEEIQKIKNQYIASKIYERETLESYAFSLGHGFAQTGNIHCEEEFIQNIRRTNLNEVNLAFNQIFQRPIHIDVQLPKDVSPAPFEKLLKSMTKTLHAEAKTVLTKAKTLPIKTSSFDPKAQVITLKKGLKLIYRHNPMIPTFIFHAYIKGGLSEEQKKNNGLYHMISGLLTKGYKGLRCNNLKNILEERSASLNGFSGKNAYGLTLHGLTEHFPETIKHFFGSLYQPEFADQFLNQQKEILLRSLESQEEDPLKQCFKTFNQIIFQDHPYAMDILGTKDSLKRLKSLELKKLHKANLQNKEMLFTYCGDLSLNQVLASLSPYLEELPSRPAKKTLIKKIDSQFGQEVFIPFDREQTQIIIGLPSYKLGTKEDIFLKILTSYLSGQSSELFVEVRDRQGLCYTVQPVHLTALEGGYWGIYIASGYDKTEKAIKAIKDLLKKMQRKGLPVQEFKRVKKMILGQNDLHLQTNDDFATTYSIPELHGLGLDYHYLINEKMNQMKHEEFNDFLAKFLGKSWNTVIVGRKV